MNTLELKMDNCHFYQWISIEWQFIVNKCNQIALCCKNLIIILRRSENHLPCLIILQNSPWQPPVTGLVIFKYRLDLQNVVEAKLVSRVFSREWC